MRRLLFTLLLLTACQLTVPGAGTPTALSDAAVAVAPGDAIQTTKLDAPAAGDTAKPADAAPPVVASAPSGEANAPSGEASATAATPHPKARPATLSALPAGPESQPAADAAPAVPPSPAQLLCEKSGGQWSIAGDSGANICVKRTRDGGKRCTRKSECQGQCLARSNTCSPIDPMFGCNDILESDGRQMTLCLG